jgi:hypothetical protein
MYTLLSVLHISASFPLKAFVKFEEDILAKHNEETTYSVF